jgi:hypothetical protein
VDGAGEKEGEMELWLSSEQSEERKNMRVDEQMSKLDANASGLEYANSLPVYLRIVLPPKWQSPSSQTQPLSTGS